MTININGTMSDKELQYYKDRALINYSTRTIKTMDITVDGEFVDIKYAFEPVCFERIRRITGYLSNLKNFNNAKACEESERVKHDA